MAKESYRWIQMWGIQDDEGELNLGDVVEVVNSSGDSKLVEVTCVFPFTTKAGKRLDRAMVKDYQA